MNEEVLGWFVDCATVADVKKTYYRKAMEVHPDHGGDEEVFKVLNNEYHNALRILDGQETIDTQGYSHTYYYNYERESHIMDLIKSLLHLRMEDVEIHLMGIFVWVMGDTKPYKEEIKSLGRQYGGSETMSVHWHSKKFCWYFKPYSYRSFNRNNRSLDDIALAYGSKTFGHIDDSLEVQ